MTVYSHKINYHASLAKAIHQTAIIECAIRNLEEYVCICATCLIIFYVEINIEKIYHIYIVRYNFDIHS